MARRCSPCWTADPVGPLQVGWPVCWPGAPVWPCGARSAQGWAGGRQRESRLLHPRTCGVAPAKLGASNSSWQRGAGAGVPRLFAAQLAQRSRHWPRNGARRARHPARTAATQTLCRNAMSSSRRCLFGTHLSPCGFQSAHAEAGKRTRACRQALPAASCRSRRVLRGWAGRGGVIFPLAKNTAAILSIASAFGKRVSSTSLVER